MIGIIYKFTILAKYKFDGHRPFYVGQHFGLDDFDTYPGSGAIWTHFIDRMKKDFWISKGYDFYALDIRDYSILEMCQLFFNIKSLPDWINYEYSNKLNLKIVQELLNKGLSVIEVAEKLNINKHRIYDALHYNKLYYPKDYKYINLIKRKYIHNESRVSSETTGYVR